MGQRFEELSDTHIAFILQQPLFFAGSAAPSGRVNVSPKGMDSLRVLGPSRIVWINHTGSGNETAAHVAEDPRMTLMWCSFAKKPLILRAYGTARVLHRDAPDWSEHATRFGNPLGARQIYDLAIDLVQSSCGYAVPLMTFDAERTVLQHWSEDKGADGLRRYWAERNTETLDGKPTGIEANFDDA